MRVFVGALCVVLILLAVPMAWLLWPIPSTAVDWHEMLRDSADADCDLAFFLVVEGSSVDPDGSEEAIDIVAASRCSWIVDPQNPENSLDRIRQSVESGRTFDRLRSDDWWSGVNAGYAAFTQVQRARSVGNLPPAFWGDAVMAFRCERAVHSLDAAAWLAMRWSLPDYFDESEVASHIGILTKCRAHMQRLLDELPPAGPSQEEDDGHAMVRDYYETTLELIDNTPFMNPATTEPE